MARQRDPKRDQAYEIWKQHNGEITNRALAEQLGVPEKTISAWKSRDKWNVALGKNDCSTTKKECSTTKEKGNKKERAPNKRKPVAEEAETGELTDKQELFCIHYVKSFNATMAAIKAGYAKESAHVEGSRLLRNAKVSDYIRELKGAMQQELFVEATDLMNYYMKIAFADITDYVTFQRKDVQTGRFDAVLAEDGKTIIDMVPRVDSYNEMFFKNSDEIDGTIVAEVKQGRDGVGVKLVDKKWAMDKLDRYFDMFPDAFKRRIEEEKLKIAQAKALGDDDDSKEKDVAAALRGLVDGINTKAD